MKDVSSTTAGLSLQNLELTTSTARSLRDHQGQDIDVTTLPHNLSVTENK